MSKNTKALPDQDRKHYIGVSTETKISAPTVQCGLCSMDVFMQWKKNNILKAFKASHECRAACFLFFCLSGCFLDVRRQNEALINCVIRKLREEAVQTADD